MYDTRSKKLFRFILGLFPNGGVVIITWIIAVGVGDWFWIVFGFYYLMQIGHSYQTVTTK